KDATADYSDEMMHAALDINIPNYASCDRNYQSDRCVDLGCQRDGWCSSAMSQQAGNELSVYSELLVLQRATKGKECAMIDPILRRRHFNHSSLISLLAAAALPDCTAAAQQQATSHATRRDVIRHELPGEPLRDISLIEVTYPPATGSPPHLHANGVMA